MSHKVFDFKKEYKDLYMPKNKPTLIEVPNMNFIMVDGVGDPNNSASFEEAVELLYGLSYAIKMSIKKGNQPAGYFEYVVPPLEGLWCIEGGEFSFEERDNWRWTVMIRQPEFVDEAVFQYACSELKRKKTELSIDRARFENFEEGLCVQMMHLGPYSTEPETMKEIDRFLLQEGFKDRLGKGGRHHEIYLSDPRRAKEENMKTVLRHPIERA